MDPYRQAELGVVTQTTSAPKERRSSSGKISSGSWRSWFVWFSVICGIVLFIIILATVIPSVYGNAKAQAAPQMILTDNYTAICACRDGLPGSPGQQGVPGESITGPSGPIGPSGPSGVAICLANPTCASGPSGPSGPSGASGARGNQGYPGNDGATGPAGPSGPSGATGATGPTGPTGPTGEAGLNGTCDCFDLPNITINTTYVTGTLDVQGNLTCSSTSFISSQCFPNVCFNFSSCDLEARSLFIGGAGTQSRLIIGEDATVLFGSAPSGNVSVAYQMLLYQSYSRTTIIESSIYTVLRTTAGDMLIQALGSLSTLLTIASQGLITIQAGGAITLSAAGSGDITLQTSGLNNRINLQAPGGILSTGDSFNVSSQSFVFTAGGSDIYMGGNVNTLICNSTAPAGVDTTANSVVFRQDVVLQNGAQIISGENSGEVSLGPFLSICGAQIMTPGSVQLQINADIYSTGAISSAGSCCTSDHRVKTNVRHPKHEKSLDILKKFPPVIFDWTEDFQKSDTWARNHPRDIYGFIAQDVELVYPQAITYINKTVGKARYDDFRYFNKDEMVPLVASSVIELDTRLEQQKELIEHLNKRIEMLEDIVKLLVDNIK